MSCFISLVNYQKAYNSLGILTECRNSDVASEPSDAFLEDLDSLLQDTDCHGSLGIDTVPQHDWAEFSIGEASVVVRSNNVPLTDFVPVAFVFDQDKAGYRVVKNCKKGIRHTSKKP